MNTYEDLVNGKSLDELLREARQEESKKELALVKVEERERTGREDNKLITIIGREFVSKNYEIFSRTVRRISDVDSLFFTGGDYLSVLKELVELRDLLESIEISDKLRSLLCDIKDKFVGRGRGYIERLENPSQTQEDWRIGDKVKTVFVPFSETKLSGYKKEYINSNGNETNGSSCEYFNERNANFPSGSIGKIIGFYTDNLAVQFDKDGKWNENWFPDANYWKERRNVGLYEYKELRIMPFSVVEVCVIKTLFNNIQNKFNMLI